jgi:Fis family transcriptional regulator
MTTLTPPTLSQAVESSLKHYFDSLNGEMPTRLHQMVIYEVEKSLFESVMNLTEGNQTRAAQVLGINRNTLRSRLAKFDLL